MILTQHPVPKRIKEKENTQSTQPVITPTTRIITDKGGTTRKNYRTGQTIKERDVDFFKQPTSKKRNSINGNKKKIHLPFRQKS